MASGLATALAQEILEQAVTARVSDIHLEPFVDSVAVRFRADGMLSLVRTLTGDDATRVLSRFKVLALLDIAEKRLPQDGGFVAEVAGKHVDVRVATFPTRYGEKVVLRVLDHAHGVKSMSDLGCPAELLQTVISLVNRPQGLFIVTGPTGSGKTTTLYALLSHIASEERNTVTLEDPIEYTIPKTVQCHIRPDIGFDFAAGIRSVLRQDPDIIMVGEMRDPETASAAVRAALTGHQVLTTLHTIDAISVISRMIDMGIEPFLITAVVRGVLAQRLVRVICQKCRVEAGSVTVGEVVLEPTFRGAGCVDCAHRGYYGRTGIFELFVLTKEVREAILTRVPADDLAILARNQGMSTLHEDAYAKIRAGITTVEEMFRVL